MKEQKFRTYDTQNGRMIYYTWKDLMEAALAADLVYHLVPDNICELIDLIDRTGLNLPQMQFTGKQDMNGKDIYEDDIIYREICSPDDPAYGFYGDIGVIKEDPHGMGWFIDAVDNNYLFYDHMNANFSFDQIKVIDNIYEDLIGE